MTQAQRAHHAGLAELVRLHHGEPFTVDGHARTFTGLVGDIRFSNSPGEGGFLPAQNGMMTVTRDEFETVGIVPKLGMRIVVRDRAFIVTDVAPDPYCWVLTLELASPKSTSDLAPQ
jgi:hypothetical protein